MRIKLFLLLFFVIKSGFCQVDTALFFNKYWVVPVDHYDTGDSASAFFIIKINSNEAEFYSPIIDSIQKMDTRNEGSLIDSIFGQNSNVQISEDSILFESQGGKIKYYALKESVDLDKEKINLDLIKSYWYNSELKDTMKFYETIMDEPYGFKASVYDPFKAEDTFVFWKISEYQGNLFLYYNKNNIDYNFQLIEKTEDIIKGIRYTSSGIKEIELFAIKTKDPSLQEHIEKRLTEARLTKRDFRVKRFEGYGSKMQFPIGELDSESGFPKFVNFFKNYPSLEQFIKGKITFEFLPEGSYIIKYYNRKNKANIIISKGDWFLTNDNKEIMFIDEEANVSYAEIVDYDKNKIKLIQNVALAIEKKRNIKHLIQMVLIIE